MKPTTPRIKVLLAAGTDELQALRKQLKRVLQKAGMEVLDLEQIPPPQWLVYFGQAACSVHLLGSHYMGNRARGLFSPAEQHFRAAQTHGTPLDDFKIFVWQPPVEQPADEQQHQFLNEVRNSLLHNTVYSKHDSPVLFVEEIRGMLQQEKKIEHNSKVCDVCLIHNALDLQAGREIEEMLGDILRVERLSVEMTAGFQNIEPVADQILKAALTVVYFEKTMQWAIPFTQQIWRKIGGASAPTQLLLVADADVAMNQQLQYDAPRVHPLIVSKELAALEIKIHYDKLVGKA